MIDQPTTATVSTSDAAASRSCQAYRCPLPPSLLPWTLDYGGETFELWLCCGHGQLLSREQTSADAGGEAA